MDIRRSLLMANSITEEEEGNILTLKYDINSTSSETQIISTTPGTGTTVQGVTYVQWDLNQLVAMYIDDVEYTPKYTHKFTSTGIHTIKLVFNDTFNTMGMMFTGCNRLKEVDFTNTDLSNVTIMGGVWGDCTSLTSINFANVDTSNVTTMMGLVDSCTALETIDLSMFNTSKVTDFAYMFHGCTSLTSIDLSNFDTTSLTDMYQMFTDCSNLKTANLSSFNTSKVIDFSRLFKNCSKLESVDMRNIVSTNITTTANYGEMFYGCLNLKTIYWGMKTAPTVYKTTFGNSNSTYTGYNTRSNSVNKLYLPTGHSGYTTAGSWVNKRYWKDVLQNTSYCGFTIATY